MKKSITLLSLLCLLLSGACAFGENTAYSEPPLISQDLSRGNMGTMYYPAIFKTETGFYYNMEKNRLSLKYYDNASQKSIYLCNKPECRHDGNEFCVATNSKYLPLGMQLYSDRLYILALESTEDALEYKLLEASLDGSRLTETATVYTHSSLGFCSGNRQMQNNLIIHRNKAVIQIRLSEDKPESEDIYYYGTMLLDLETGKVNSIYEEPVSRENPEWINVSTYGDYVYYVVKEPHKQRLHRYSLTDGSDQVMQFVPNFDGNYLVLGEDRILYTRNSRGSRFIHTISTNANEKLELKFYRTQMIPINLEAYFTANNFTPEDIKTYLEYSPDIIVKEDGYYQEMKWETCPTVFFYDDTYVYFTTYTYNIPEEVEKWDAGMFFVCDKDFNIVCERTMPTYETITGTPARYEYWSYYFLDGMIYCYQPLGAPEVFAISREDFISGSMNFELAYVMDQPAVYLPEDDSDSSEGTGE